MMRWTRGALSVGLSIFNAAEACAAIAVVERLLAAAQPKPAMKDGKMGVTSPGDIGIIAPYAAQVRVLHAALLSAPRRVASHEPDLRANQPILPNKTLRHVLCADF